MKEPDRRPGGSAADARLTAAQALGAVLRERRRLDAALDGHPATRRLAPRDAAFARRLVLATLRRLGQIDAILDGFLDRPLALRLALVRDLMRVGAAQLLFLDTPAHAAVDSAVAALGRGRFAPYRGLVNAVLRRIAAEGSAILTGQDAARLNTPDWLWRSWENAYGAGRCEAIAAAHLSEPPLDLSVARDPDMWARRLGATKLATGTLRLTPTGPITALPGYDAGAWWVQDAAAALPARLLGAVRGKRVVEIGAAPGGKTAQLAAAGASVTAVDRSPRRIDRLRGNLARLGLTAEIVEADAREWRPDIPAAAVLLDTPCTATGTIRRHPEIARLRAPDDLPPLCATQDTLLAAALGMLAPGGVLVYVTCSIQPEECAERIESLLAARSDLRRDPVDAGEIAGLAGVISEAGDLRTLPAHEAARGGMDGFYAARLRLRD